MENALSQIMEKLARKLCTSRPKPWRRPAGSVLNDPRGAGSLACPRYSLRAQRMCCASIVGNPERRRGAPVRLARGLEGCRPEATRRRLQTSHRTSKRTAAGPDRVDEEKFKWIGFFRFSLGSIYPDLKDARLAVSNALAKAGYMPAGMELFPATDQQQHDYIKRVIDRSDYYIAIVGGRYGSLSDGGLNFTEEEFEYARSKDIPILAFVSEDRGDIAIGKTETDITAKRKTGRFQSAFEHRPYR